MNYDLAVIGAGPAGLMAAKRAAEEGLNVVLIEKFDDISTVRRACCQQFVMDENYERENIEVTGTKIIFPRNGFSVDYDGPRSAITETRFVSPGGRAVRFRYPDGRPVAVKFDKGYLLQHLLDECRAQGVHYRNNTLAYMVKDTGSEVEIHVTAERKRSIITAAKAIAADGVNSRAAESLGLNRQRKHFATALCIIYSIEGVEGHDPAVMTWHMGQAYGSYAPVILDPSLHGSGVADLVVMGSAHQRPENIFTYFTTKSPCARLFKNARVLKRTGCTVKAYSALPAPYAGNVLLAGDAAAYIEVEVQGALMCGYHGAAAVLSELSGSSGFEQYGQWWRDTFEFNSEDALRVAQGYALVPAYSDDEIDYLFSLIESSTLDGAYGQYKAPRLLWEAINSHADTISRERPDLYEKINSNSLLTFENTFQQTRND